MTDLEKRIAGLTSEARRLLADALSEYRNEGSGSSDSDGLVAYVVATPDTRPDVGALRAHVKSSLPDYMVPGSFVFLEEMPRTLNGKVDFDRLPDPERPSAAGSLDFAPPQSDKERIIAGIWAKVLGIEEIGTNDNFFEIGGDSILSIRIVALARDAGLAMTPSMLFDYQTVAELARAVESGPIAKMRIPDSAPFETGDTSFNLTPIQHWFFEQRFPAPNHWNQSLLLQAVDRVRLDWLQRAVDGVVEVHPMLRARFTSAGATRDVDGLGIGATGSFTTDRIQVEHVDLSAIPASELEHLVAETAAKAESTLDIANGPVTRVLLFDRGPSSPSEVLLCMHHLVTDVLSAEILLADLAASYRSVAAGAEPVVQRPATNYVEWARHLTERAASSEFLEDVRFWMEQRLPRTIGFAEGASTARHTEATAAMVEVALTAEKTASLLSDVPGVYGTRTDEVLLAALAVSIGRKFGRDGVYVGIERHGRETGEHSLDLTRTVGWFTSYHPVLLTVNTEEFGRNPGAVLKSVKEQLRAVPGKGMPFGIGRYLCPDPEVRRALSRFPEPALLFNYAGRIDAAAAGTEPFVPAGTIVTSRSPLNHRGHEFEVNAFVADGRLTMRWQFSADVFATGFVEELAGAMCSDLEGLVGHCLTTGAGGYTPSDFPDIDLGQDDLDRLLGSIPQ